MRRLQANDVTEAVMQATELAGDMGATQCLIILCAKPAEDSELIALVGTDSLDGPKINWLMDKLKIAILTK